MPTPTNIATNYCGRFAPSPTGRLHLGSLVAALGSWLFARQAGGHWLVRIEDIDPPREVPGAASAQLRTLRALGLEPDGEVVYQSRRSAAYRAAVDSLLASGHAFVCHCSRSDLASSHGIHRRCVRRAMRPDPAIRLRVPDGTRISVDDAIQGRLEQDLARDVGDFVLRRADGPWAYQLAVVVDDAAQGVTEVVRGADLLESTPRQTFIRQLLGLPEPGHVHLPLVLDNSGGKLSKSTGAVPVDDADPAAALRAAWRLLGQDPAALAANTNPDRMLMRALAAFDRGRIGKAPMTLAAMHNTGPASCP